MADKSGAGTSLKVQQPSRLVTPGSLTKRPRPKSIELETGVADKKMKMEPPEPKMGLSNLTRAKSKSTMSLADRSATRGGRLNTTSTIARPALNRSTVSSVRPGIDRRATTASALNSRTDKENRLNREKSSVGPGFAREKSSVGPGFAREKSTVSRGGGAARGGKRPAWDLKGRLEDMESKFSETLARVTDLESEKRNLETDNEVKKEVVTQTHKEVVDLRQQLDDAQAVVDSLKKKINNLEEEHSTEVNRLRRQLENEEFAKSSLERRLKSLEDELSSKQTEVSGLKNSVAELSSSRAGLEANYQNTTAQLETAKTRITELEEKTESQSKEVEKMKEKLNWEETERRKLHNLVQELKGNIRVFCRVRPLLGDEIQKYGSIQHLVISNEKSLELVKNTGEKDDIAGGLHKNMKYEFEFDRVFDQSATQDSVFQEISQLVQSALDGYNVCVFAYGQTGSGKTYTMEGGDVEDLEQAGMIPKTIKQIFEVTERLKEKGWEYSFQASFLEIYNEEIRDLLATEKNLKYDIKMTDSKGSDMFVTNLKVESVTSETMIYNLMKRARKHRAVAETLCNERSSRSHSIFMLRITGTNSVTTESCCGTLNLVDLAGSERVKESGSEGQRLTEAQAINKSLSNLGNVIMALAQKNSHVPYRNSKLTHLLQNCLGGNSKTLMFVNLNPKEDSFNETLNSLRFATKVNQCNIGTAVKKVK